MPEAALDWAGENLVHGLVAAVVVLTLLQLWGLRHPGTRLRFLLLALLFPVLLQPLLVLFAPQRHSQAFVEEHSLFALERYRDLKALGLPADMLLLAGFALLAVTLLLRDLAPALSERFEAVPGELDDHTLRPSLREIVAQLSERLGVEPPRLRLVDLEAPEISCAGLRRHRLTLASGTVRRLSPEELQAALAHELAHLRGHDLVLGWVLLAVRTVFFFNPAVQILARVAHRDLESRADDAAVAVVGTPTALAAALVKAFRAGVGHRRLGVLLDPLRLGALERRCRRLLEPAPGRRLRFEALHYAATALGLAGLLFFVV